MKPAKGRSYAGIKMMRRTRAGDILQELSNNTKDNAGSNSKLKQILDEIANVSRVERRITLEMKDLECVTTVDDVQATVKRTLGNFERQLMVNLTDANSREL